MLLRVLTDPLSIQMLVSLVSVRQYSEQTLREVKALNKTHTQIHTLNAGKHRVGPHWAPCLVELL